MVQDCYLVHALTELAGATFMIFTRTADGAQKLALLLRNLSFAAIPIYGKMSQDKRIGALNKFKAGQCSILVATGQPDDICLHGPFTDCVAMLDGTSWAYVCGDIALCKCSAWNDVVWRQQLLCSHHNHLWSRINIIEQWAWLQVKWNMWHE